MCRLGLLLSGGGPFDAPGLFEPAAAVLVVEVGDDFDGFLRFVAEGEDVEVFGGDIAAFAEHFAFQPVHQSAPVFFIHADDGEIGLLEGLDEDQGLEEFVHGAESAGHGDEAVGVFEEHDLPAEEIPEIEGDILVLVGKLLVGQFDIEADAFDAGFAGAFVGGFHDAAASAGDDGKAGLADLAGGFDGQFVIGFAGGGAGGAEDGDGRTDGGKLVKAFDEFGHNAENTPCFAVQFTVFGHTISRLKKVTALYLIIKIKS